MPVAARYTIAANGSIGFALGAYDPAHALTIDPTLNYSTYLGGSGEDHGDGIAVDSAGNAYVTGGTSSTNFPTANPLQPAYGGNRDAFVAKLAADGSSLVYSTYLGGSDYDRGYRIAVDSAGGAYITGRTDSTDFPTANPLQPTYGGQYDAFVSKLAADGGALLYSTYFGGSDRDYGYGIGVDSTGNVYVTGWTYSTNFPTASPLQPICASCPSSDDAFVAKLTADGSTLLYSTYLGGSNDDGGNGIAVDNAGIATVAGRTESTDFPTANPLQPVFGGNRDAFVTMIGNQGELEGTVTGLDYCDGDPAPLAGADVLVEGSSGASWTLTTDASGFYDLWLDESESPLTVTVTHAEHETGVASGVIITAWMTTTQDFDLHWLQPCLSVDPDRLDVTLDMGQSTTLPLTLTNSGAAAATFELQERGGGVAPLLAGSGLPHDVSVTGPDISQSLEADMGQVTLSGPAAGTRGPAFSPDIPNPWVTIPPNPLGVSRPAGALVDGKFYIIGGESSGGPFLGQVQVYDPDLGTWDSSLPTMPTPGSNLCAAVIGTDIYVPGGYNGAALTALQIFHTDSNTWETVATDPLPAARLGPACASFDGKLYVIGGIDGSYRNTTWTYDPATAAGSRWTTLANAPIAAAYGAALAVNDLIFYAGMVNPGDRADVYAYDPANDNWTTYPNLQTARGGAGIWATGDILIVGGGGWSSYLTSVEEYDTSLGAGGAWSYTNPLNQGRRTFARASDPARGICLPARAGPALS